MIWICNRCQGEEGVHKVTDGTLFVLHHCRCFGSSLVPDGRRVHRYVDHLQSFFQNQPNDNPVINITVFPLKETA